MGVRVSVVALVVLTLVALEDDAAAARSECTAAKVRASGRKASDEATCFATAAAAGGTLQPRCLSKAEIRLTSRFTKAERMGACLTSGDARAIGSKVDAFVGDLATTVTGRATGPFAASRCNAHKIEAAGKQAAARASCRARVMASGRAVVSDCPSNAGARLGKAIARAEGRKDCTRTGQRATLETAVDAFIGDLTSALRPTPTTTTVASPDTTTTIAQPPPPTAHYQYVFPDGSFSVYDMDDGHRLVKTVPLPQARGIRGVVANAPTHSLYVSYGGDGNGQNGTPTMLKYDLLTDAVVWTHSYPVGIDSMSVSPDGRVLYMPTGELARGGTWYVIRASDGDVIGTIDGPTGPHNTIVSLDGARVYLGGRADDFLVVADGSTHRVLRRIGPLQSSVRPFTINGRETLAYITITGLRGFQIGDIATGQGLGTFTFSGSNVSGLNGPSAPSHGISLSPDERELYVVDWPDWVHVFDVSGVFARAPRQVADIALTPSMNHRESPCLYDCLADGWLEHSRDGRFVYVGDQGDVIDTATRRAVTNLPALYNTRKMIEIDWAHGVPVFAATSRASVGYVR